ncbi:MAG: nucleotide exchange factor GrpE [Acidobacteriota bacterium]|nr:nucleotide exchange factor GrpE [Acidobacteriota bacterium]
MPDEHQTEQSEPATPQPEQPHASTPSNPADGPDDTTVEAATEASASSEENRSEPSVNLEAVVRQRDDYYDRLLRITAEFDNYRKRTERERRDLIAQAAGDLLGDLLPVVDDFERALAADAQDGPAYRQGVEIIHKQLLEVMTRHGVSAIEAVGADFDPLQHQAVAHEPSESHKDGEVIEELRRGYTLRDRLLRPSMVKVAKA